MNTPSGGTIATITTLSYINWPWVNLDEFTKIGGFCIAVFLAFLAYRKHRLEMKVLNRSLTDASKKREVEKDGK